VHHSRRTGQANLAGRLPVSAAEVADVIKSRGAIQPSHGQCVNMSDHSQALIRLGVPTLYEAAGRRGLMEGIRILVGPAFVGRAQTTEIVAGDNLGIHRGLASPRDGDVYCVASPGQGRYGVIGELLVEQLRVAGWTAVVLDDGARDTDLLNAPPTIAARGVCSRGTIKLRTGRIHDEIVIGGIMVRPGDWVVGDNDGVMVIPVERIETVVGAAQQRMAKESRVAELLKTGMTVLDATRLAGAELAGTSGHALPV
jgi:4-hydroxy-4-methyl-2-oxoglutarate aldolase